jgi:hypothetical protein
MRRRRDPGPIEAAEGYELCAMCGEPVVVGADGRCELGHRVRLPAPEAWAGDEADPAATTMPIAPVGLEDPAPQGEILQALAGPLDLDADEADVDETDVDDEPDVDEEPDADGPSRRSTDLGGELEF